MQIFTVNRRKNKTPLWVVKYWDLCDGDWAITSLKRDDGRYKNIIYSRYPCKEGQLVFRVISRTPFWLMPEGLWRRFARAANNFILADYSANPPPIIELEKLRRRLRYGRN